MYGWASRDRLAPMRMVWPEHNYRAPRHEERLYGRRSLRARTQMDWEREPGVEADRERRQSFPGRLGEWPLWRPDVKRRKR